MIHYFYKLAFGTLGEYRYFNTVFHFRFPFFEWIPVFNDTILKILFIAGILISILFTLGLFYKVSSKILLILYLYIYFIDQSYWNNHYYLFSIFALFFAFTNAHNSISIDSFRKNLNNQINNWEILIFKIQITIVYFYGGISKLSNPEWLNFAAPKALYSNYFHKIDYEITETALNSLGQFIGYGGLFFDLFIGIFLWINNKTLRVIGLILCCAFHISNIYIFEIGAFPYAMLASNLLFISIFFDRKTNKPTTPININQKVSYSPANQWVIRSIAVFFAIQLILPFQHLLFKGNVFWTGEGKMYGWHMMSGSTDVIANDFYIQTFNDEGEFTGEDIISTNDFLNINQIRNLGIYPSYIPQFIQFLKKEAALAGMENIKILAPIEVSRNHKELRFIVSPTNDLCELENDLFKHNNWIYLYKAEGY